MIKISMQKAFFIAFSLLCFLLVAMPTYALTTININNIGDSFTNQAWTTLNYGTQTSVFTYVYTNSIERTYILWNLSIIPDNNTIIKNANLSLYEFVLPSVARTINAYNSSNSWLEDAITWNNQPSLSILQDSKTALTEPNFMYWNITNSVIYQFLQGNKNLSIVMIDEGGNSIYSSNQYYSKEYSNISLRPSLIITYCNNNTWRFINWTSCSNWTQSMNLINDCNDFYTDYSQNQSCYSGNTSYNYCYDNNTLITGNILLYNGKEYSLTEPTLCADGCDNVTNTCNPPEYQQNLIILFIIVIFLTIGAILIGRASR